VFQWGLVTPKSKCALLIDSISGQGVGAPSVRQPLVTSCSPKPHGYQTLSQFTKEAILLSDNPEHAVPQNADTEFNDGVERRGASGPSEDQRKAQVERTRFTTSELFRRVKLRGVLNFVGSFSGSRIRHAFGRKSVCLISIRDTTPLTVWLYFTRLDCSPCYRPWHSVGLSRRGRGILRNSASTMRRHPNTHRGPPGTGCHTLAADISRRQAQSNRGEHTSQTKVVVGSKREKG